MKIIFIDLYGSYFVRTTPNHGVGAMWWHKRSTKWVWSGVKKADGFCG